VPPNRALLHKLQHQTNNNGATPLIVAATWGVVDIFQRLMQVADLDVVESVTKSGKDWGVTCTTGCLIVCDGGQPVAALLQGGWLAQE